MVWLLPNGRPAGLASGAVDWPLGGRVQRVIILRLAAHHIGDGRLDDSTVSLQDQPSAPETGPMAFWGTSGGSDLPRLVCRG